MHIQTIAPIARITDGTNRTHSASYEVYSDDGRVYVVHCSRYFDRLDRKAHHETEIYVSGRRIPETQLADFRSASVRIFKQDVREFAERF